MNQIILEKEQVNYFRYVYTYDEGTITKNLELEYASPLLTEIVKVTFQCGMCGEKHFFFDTLSGHINFDAAPNFIFFNNENGRARFFLSKKLHLVFEYAIDEDTITPFFTIMLEEY